MLHWNAARLHVARFSVHAGCCCAVQVAFPKSAVCTVAVFCDRSAAVGIVRVVCCMLRAGDACCMLHTQNQALDNVACALHDAHNAVRAPPMLHFDAFLRGCRAPARSAHCDS